MDGPRASTDASPDERPEHGEARRAREHRYWRRTRALLAALLAMWAAATFGLVYFARELNAWSFAGWPLGYWLAAQGIPLGFILIVVLHARVMGRADKRFETER